MSKWKALITSKKFLIFVVLIVFALPAYRAYENLKPRPIGVDATAPVVLEDGNTVYTLYHRDPRGEQVEIYPWTITLPSDAYVWREEASEGSKLRSLQVNGVSLNTTVRPNSNLVLWLKIPELVLLTSVEEDKISSNNQNLYHNGVLVGKLVRLSLSGVIHEKKYDSLDARYCSIQKNINQEILYIQETAESKSNEYSECKYSNRIFDSNLIFMNAGNIIGDGPCTGKTCLLRLYIREHMYVRVNLAREKIEKLPIIFQTITKIFSNSIDINENAKRTAW